MYIQNDTVSAFMPYPKISVSNAKNGPLSGLTFAVKDLFDIKGYQTSCGCPLKLAQSLPAKETAPIVQIILNAGASFVGKTKTDEFAWSLEGVNPHFGTPINPVAPNRIPGGSSAGSASATSAGLVDFAIGTDTGGSVRLPASFCGIWGMRPTFGRLSISGCMELAKSFDTVGFFAMDGAVFEKVASTLFTKKDEIELTDSIDNFLIVKDMFEVLDKRSQVLLKSKLPFDESQVESVDVFRGQKESIYYTFRVIQAHEALSSLGQWVQDNNPPLTYAVKDRFEFASKLTTSDLSKAESERKDFRSWLNNLLKDGKILIVPTTISEAPLLSASKEEMLKYRHECLPLLCVAGNCGVPQVSVPVTCGPMNAPIGLSLIGPCGSDYHLVKIARTLFPNC